jgi:hypothetical protein
MIYYYKQTKGFIMKKLLLLFAMPTIILAEDYVLQLENKSYKESIKVSELIIGEESSETESTFSSCENIYQSDNNSISGVFNVDKGNGEYSVYCHFQNGGWTLVAAQFESNPVTWNEGIQSDYDPSLSSGQSFTLNSNELPSHSKVLFEKIDNVSSAGVNSFSDWFDYQYTTGNINLTTIAESVSGVSFQIHRDINSFYGWHNPEEGLFQNIHNEWENTLTVDKVGGRNISYAFSPQQNIQQSRGYSFNGVDYQSTLENSAWVVWVR